MPRPKKDVWGDMNARVFKRVDNARANQLALKRMSKAEKETGFTADQLTEIQRRLKEDFLRRRAA